MVCSHLENLSMILKEKTCTGQPKSWKNFFHLDKEYPAPTISEKLGKISEGSENQTESFNGA